MKKIFYSVLFFAFLSAAAAANDAPRPSMVFIGDSLTAGYGVTPAESYPGRIQERMEKEGWDFSFENLSGTHDTSAQALSHASQRLSRPIDVLIVAIGYYDGVQGLPFEKLEKNLGRIAGKAYAANKNVRIVILGMRVAAERGVYARRFNDVFRKVAWEFRTAYLPFLLEDVINVPRLTLADRVHPNAEGHQLVADRVWGVLAPQLRRYFPLPKK